MCKKLRNAAVTCGVNTGHAALRVLLSPGPPALIVGDHTTDGRRARRLDSCSLCAMFFPWQI